MTQKWPRALAWGLLVVLTSGCSAALVRPDEGECRGADVATWAKRAAASLVTRPYRPAVIYDVGRQGLSTVFRAGPLDPDARAVVSYPDVARFPGQGPGFDRVQDRSFVYDDALVALWLTSRGDRDGARRILSTLAALQRPDGAWGFSFQTGRDGFYNAGYVRAGTVAWVVYAFARYASKFDEMRWSSTIDRGVAWLVRQHDPVTGLVSAGLGRWVSSDVFDPDWVGSFASTEHQLDIWFAFQAAQQADPAVASRWQLARAAQALVAAVDAFLWRAEEGRYVQGIAGTRIDEGSALDASGTWAALYDVAVGRNVRSDSALQWVEAHHGIDVQGWAGLRPYEGLPPDTWFVEASVAVPLALSRLGRRQQALEALQPFADLACAGGVPLVYSPVWATDFPFSPATAPTVWFLFAAAEVVGGEAPFLWSERLNVPIGPAAR